VYMLDFAINAVDLIAAAGTLTAKQAAEHYTTASHITAIAGLYRQPPPVVTCCLTQRHSLINIGRGA